MLKLGGLEAGNTASSSKQYLSNSLITTLERKVFQLNRKHHLLYRSNSASANGSSSKQVCVVNAQPERKMRKELCGRLLQAAQLSAQERDENACPM